MNDCCLNNLEDSEQNLKQIVSCFTEDSNLSFTKKSTMYYICDYMTNKEGMVWLEESEIIPLPEEAEFTLRVSREKLNLRPLNLYDFSQYCYAFFKDRKEKCFTKIYLQAFTVIYGYRGYSFSAIDRITRRMCNIFFKTNKTDNKINAKRKREDYLQGNDTFGKCKPSCTCIYTWSVFTYYFSVIKY